MARGADRGSLALAWWALAKFAARPYATNSSIDLFEALTELGLGTFRSIQGRLPREAWNRKEREPTGRWVERLREEMAPLAFDEADPKTCWARCWDQKWRLVAYDIPCQPHARRQKLWRWLKQNRLGLLQRSLWISAKPLGEIRKLFHNAANTHTLLLWEASTPGGLKPVSIVEQAWDFAEIDSDYQAVLNLTAADITPVNIRMATLRWQNAVQADPLLPQGLYPKSFLGFRAAEQLERMWARFRGAGA